MNNNKMLLKRVKLSKMDLQLMAKTKVEMQVKRKLPQIKNSFSKTLLKPKQFKSSNKERTRLIKSSMPRRKLSRNPRS